MSAKTSILRHLAVAALVMGCANQSYALPDNTFTIRLPIELKQLPSEVKRVYFQCEIYAKIAGNSGSETSTNPRVKSSFVEINDNSGAISTVKEVSFITKHFDLRDLHDNGDFVCKFTAMVDINGNALWRNTITSPVPVGYTPSLVLSSITISSGPIVPDSHADSLNSNNPNSTRKGKNFIKNLKNRN